jgi:hypothetical protein
MGVGKQWTSFALHGLNKDVEIAFEEHLSARLPTLIIITFIATRTYSIISC